MKPSKHEQAVIQLTRDVLNVYFTSGLLIEYEDLDEMFQDAQNVMSCKEVLQRRRTSITRGIKKAVDEAVNAEKLVSQCIKRYTTPESIKSLSNMIECFILSLIFVSRFQTFDAFIKLIKLYKIIPEDCPAADIEYLDI